MKPQQLKGKIEYTNVLKSYKINNLSYSVIDIEDIKAAVELLKLQILKKSLSKNDTLHLIDEIFYDVMKK